MENKRYHGASCGAIIRIRAGKEHLKIMSVSRNGKQIKFPRPHRSHVSGKRGGRFAARISDNLDKQCSRLEKILCGQINAARADADKQSNLETEPSAQTYQ